MENYKKNRSRIPGQPAGNALPPPTMESESRAAVNKKASLGRKEGIESRRDDDAKTTKRKSGGGTRDFFHMITVVV